MTKSFSIPQLAERCRAEAERYRRTRQSDPTFCFELFHRALTQHLDLAWEVIVRQYEALATHWAYEYGAANLDEDPAAFVNEAFARMWQYGRKTETAARLNNLGKCLSYLKKCVWSVVEDYRQRQRQVVLMDDWRKLGPNQPILPGPETPAGLENLRHVVQQALAETVQNETERLVAELTWTYDLKPRQIQAAYSEQFASAAEVSQVKKNILKRLQRDQRLLETLRGVVE